MKLALALALLFLPARISAQDEVLAYRLDRFAKTYNQFISHFRAGEFSLSLARALSAEWRDVENSGDWPTR